MLMCLKFLGTFCFGSCMIVTLLTHCDLSLTQTPKEVQPNLRERRLVEELHLQARRAEKAERANLEKDATIATLKINVETLMKFAQIPPIREAADEDRIPPQAVPTMPAPVVVPSPEEVGVTP